MNERIENILRLKSCPQCGYDLDGLPAEHQCPECGYAFTEDMSIIPVLKKEEVPHLFMYVLWCVMAVFFSAIALAGFISIMFIILSGGAPPMKMYFFVLIMGGCAGSCIIGVREQWRGRGLVKTGTVKPTNALLLSEKGYFLREMGGMCAVAEYPRDVSETASQGFVASTAVHELVADVDLASS